MYRRNSMFFADYGRRVDLVKIDLCHALQRLAVRNQGDHQKMAIRAGTSMSCISHVFCKRVDKLTLNQLFRYLAILEPRFRILIAI